MVDLWELDLDLPPLKKQLKCTCGAQAVGYKPYMAGHADYCDVHEDKTPVEIDNSLYTLGIQ